MGLLSSLFEVRELSSRLPLAKAAGLPAAANLLLILFLAASWTLFAVGLLALFFPIVIFALPQFFIETLRRLFSKASDLSTFAGLPPSMFLLALAWMAAGLVWAPKIQAGLLGYAAPADIRIRLGIYWALLLAALPVGNLCWMGRHGPIAWGLISSDETTRQEALRRLEESNPQEKNTLAPALMKMASEGKFNGIPIGEAYLAFLKLGPDAAIPILIEALRSHPNPEAYVTAQDVLVKMKSQAAPPLVELLGSSDVEAGELALNALKRMEPADREAALASAAARKTAPGLISHLKSDEKSARLYAYRAITLLGPSAEDVLPLVVLGLKKKSDCCYAAQALGAIKPAALKAPSAPDCGGRCQRGPR
ncbi:MAG: hypothetical protein HY921_10985 [Elusimicrobia bacterium]|nr:hypothetical protein [Elusimicrobiota bacterium]